MKNRPEEGWKDHGDGRPTWTSHNPLARAPLREGYEPHFIARHGDYVTYIYKEVK